LYESRTDLTFTTLELKPHARERELAGADRGVTFAAGRLWAGSGDSYQLAAAS
jgi:hypothetical protein